MKQITEQLFAIEVPIDAENFEFSDKDYKILGTAQLTNGQVVFDFDVEPFVWKSGTEEYFMNYKNRFFSYKTPQESFISLLESKDIYLNEETKIFNV